jgi:hypothetical protein
MRPMQQDSVAILPDMQPSKEISQTNEKKLILLSPHSQSIYHHSKSTIYLVNRKYQICMLKQEYTSILLGNQTPLHNIKVITI